MTPSFDSAAALLRLQQSNETKRAYSDVLKQILAESKKPVILLIEDDASLCALYQRLFEDAARVVETHSASEAMQYLEQHDAALIISDGVGLPVLQELSSLMEIPPHVLIISGHTIPPETLTQLQLKGQILPKPFDTAKLRSAVEHWLAPAV